MPGAYPMHDKDGFIEFVTGMWLHTQHLVGKPTAAEVEITCAHFPPERLHDLLAWLWKHGQLSMAATPWELRFLSQISSLLATTP